MSNLDALHALKKNQLLSGDAWVWLYEVEVPTSPPTAYRFCSVSEVVNWQSNNYYPFPVTHTPIQQTEDGSLPRLQVQVSNITREVMATLEAHDGLIDQPARVVLVNALALSTGVPMVEARFRVQSCNATSEAVVFDLADQDMYTSRFPRQRMSRLYCRHQYRSAGCGYAVPPSSANYLVGCDKTLRGPNGCEAHGASEEAEGIEVVHPSRFGGFPGLPIPTTMGGV